MFDEITDLNQGGFISDIQKRKKKKKVITPLKIPLSPGFTSLSHIFVWVF